MATKSNQRPLCVSVTQSRTPLFLPDSEQTEVKKNDCESFIRQERKKHPKLLLTQLVSLLHYHKAGPFPSWAWLPGSLSPLTTSFLSAVLCLHFQKAAARTGVELFLLSLLYPVSPPSRMAASTTTPSAQSVGEMRRV